MNSNSASETGLNLPDELAVWLEADEAKKHDARDVHDLVTRVLELNQVRQQLEQVTQDAVGQLDRFMLERSERGFDKFKVNLPPESESYVVEEASGNVVENDTESYVATGVRWAGQWGVEFYNRQEGTRVQFKSLDFIIEPIIEPIEDQPV